MTQVRGRSAALHHPRLAGAPCPALPELQAPPSPRTRGCVRCGGVRGPWPGGLCGREMVAVVVTSGRAGCGVRGRVVRRETPSGASRGATVAVADAHPQPAPVRLGPGAQLTVSPGSLCVTSYGAASCLSGLKFSKVYRGPAFLLKEAIQEFRGRRQGFVPSPPALGVWPGPTLGAACRTSSSDAVGWLPLSPSALVNRIRAKKSTCILSVLFIFILRYAPQNKS